MRAEIIQTRLRETPFRPVRIHVSDGSSYDVRHPEMVLVTKMEILIAVTTEDDELAERSVCVDPVHITRITPINGAKPKRSRSSRK